MMRIHAFTSTWQIFHENSWRYKNVLVGVTFAIFHILLESPVFQGWNFKKEAKYPSEIFIWQGYMLLLVHDKFSWKFLEAKKFFSRSTFCYFQDFAQKPCLPRMKYHEPVTSPLWTLYMMRIHAFASTWQIFHENSWKYKNF